MAENEKDQHVENDFLEDEILNPKGDNDSLDKAKDYGGIDVEETDQSFGKDAVAQIQVSSSLSGEGSQIIRAEDLVSAGPDVDPATLNISRVEVPEAYGSLIDNNDGTYTFTPSDSFSGNRIPVTFRSDEILPEAGGRNDETGTGVASPGSEIPGQSSDESSPESDDPAGSPLNAELQDIAAETVDDIPEDSDSSNQVPEISGSVSFSVNEDGSITISQTQLLANANDIDGDTLSVQNLSAANGELTDNGDGTYTFTPDENFNGSVDLSYEVSDGITSTPGSGSIDVTAVNDAVEAGDVDLGILEEDGFIIFSAEDVIANITDIDGDEITLSEITVSEDFGTLTDNGNGTYTFQPKEDYNGNDVPLEFTVTDGETTSLGTASLDVTAVNDGPEVSGDVSFEMDEDGTITITEEQLLANASDVDGDELSVENLSTANGELTDNGDGTHTFTPDENFNGSVELSYDLSDGTTTTPASGSIDVTAVNDAVEAGDVDLGNVEEDGSITFNAEDVIANSSDIDGDDITLSEISVSDEYGTLTDNGDGTYTFQPNENYNAGDVPLEFTVTDGETTSHGTASLDVTAVNDDPAVSGDVSFEIDEDGTITITEEQLLTNASDVDGDELSVENLSAGNGELTDNGDGTYTFKPDENFNGSVDLSYDVSDGTDRTPVSGTIDVAAVNDAVQAGDVDFGSVEEDGSITFSAEDVIANSIDIDGDKITLSEISVSEDYGALTDNGNGSYTFQPNEDYNGNDVPLEFTVTDGEKTSQGTASLDVTAVNDGPKVSGGVDFTMDEDGTITISEEQLLANASDVDGDELSVENLSAGNGELTDNGDGTYTFTPDEDFNGSVELSYEVSDGTTMTPASGSIDVTAINDAVEAGDIDLGSAEEDGSITFSAEDLIANSTDIDGDEITLSEITVSEDYGTITDNRDGTYTFQPKEDYNGNDVPLEFTVTDGETTSLGTASLDVTAVNDGPEVSGDVSFEMAEDGTITITEEQLLANASDVDGDELSVENLSAGNGDLTDNGDGTYTFTPDENFNGSVDLSYDVSDGTDSTPVSGTIDVAAVNDAVEVGDADFGSVEEDGSITFSAEDVIANSTDIDGDEITLSEISVSDEYGTLTENGDGTFTFQPNENYNGNDIPLEFTVTDGETTSQGTVSLDVTAVNDGPEVSGDVEFMMDEDGSITITEDQLLANASDVDGDELSVENLSAGNGELTDNGDGTYKFTPDENFNGSVELSYDVSDGTTTIPASGSIDVTAENDAVEAGDVDLGSVEEDGSITFSVEDIIANSSDIDGDDITLSEISVSDEYGTLTENGDGTYTFQPNENYNGADVPLEFTVSDGETTSQGTASLDVTAVNDGPEVSGDVDFTMDEDGTITISEEQLLANASDVDGDELSVENLSAGNGELTDNGDGTYTFTPDENFNGSVELSYDVSDGTTTTPASGSIDVTAVNDVVEAGDVDLGSVEEDGSITFSAEDVIANSTDIDGDEITLSEIKVSENYGTLTYNGNGTYTFQPNENYSGNDIPLEFTVTDGETASQGTASLDVTAVNDGPEVSGDVDFTMDEDGTITITEEQLLANASDVDGDALSVENLSAANGELTDNGDGTYTFTPDENFNGSVELSYDVSDGTTTTPASGSIDVAAVNDAVEAGDVDLGSVEEDGSITFSAEDVIANSPDIDGDDITLSEISVSEDYGTLTNNGNGTYTFEPNEDYNGNDVPLEFTVTDGETTSQGIASLDVTAVNDGPEVSGDVSFEMAEDGTITITEEQLLANASDVDGDELSVENLSAGNGDLTDNGDGTYTFTPDENFNGSVDLSYDVSDGTDSTPVSGTIDVAAVNDAVEVGDADFGSVEEDGSITFSAEDVIANSTDIDGDEITLSEISVSDEYGTLTENGDGTFTFQPNENYNGNDIPLEFTVTDGETTSQGTVSLDVTAVNDGPEVSGDVEFMMDEDGSITITEDQLLANASDVDGDELSVENLSAGNGELTDNGDGTYKFTPDENFNGSVELSYDVSDGTTTIPASGSIDVTAENDAVEAGDVDLGSVEEDGSITFSVEDIIANSSDIDGDDITLSEISVSDEYGTLTENGDGTYTFQPNENYNGADVPLEFTVSDGETTSQGTASLDVTAVNDGPEVSGDVDFTMDEDGTITISEEQLLANASDVDGDELSVENLSAGNGELTDNGDGTYTFTPDENFNGSVELSYDVSDGTTTTPASGSIDVTAVNDVVEAGDVDLGSVEEDGSITFSAEDVIANSTDIDGDEITLSEIKVSENYGTLTYNGNGTYTFQPNENYSGNDIPLEFTVTDGETASQGTASLDVTAVNDGPEVSGDVDFTMDEDGTITITEEQLLANASDVDGDALSVENLSAANGELTDNGDGTYTFTPDENFNGSVELSYDVSDGTTTTPASGSIDVAAVNDAVEAGDVDLGSVEEDGSITFSAEDVIANSPDIDGDDITLSEISVSEDYGTLTNNGNGTYTFEPNEDYNGNDVPLEFTVTDGETTSQGIASLDVTAVNDGPEVSGDVSFEMAEDGTITITEEQLLANASDVDGDELSVENLSAGNGDLTDNGDGTYTFTPDENFNGSVDLSYDVSDGTDSTPVSGTIDVAAVNDAVEVGDADFGSVEEDGSITFSAEDVIANSTDIDGDEITLSEISVSDEYGTLTENGDGTFTFQPNENYNGNDIPLEFTVTDGETTSQGTVSLDVTAVNDGPEVSGDVEFMMDEDGSITITEDQLLANASDVDGDELSVENLSAGNGELTDNGDGTYKFTPDENFNGSVELSYDVSDGTTTTPASGSIDVTAVNDAVEAGDVDLGRVEEDGSITFSAEDIIANSSDIDGDDITLSEISVSDEYGRLTENGDGTYTFQPNENYNGADVPLEFTVSDGETTSQGTASLDVTAVNDGPEVSGDVDFTMDEDGTITISEEQLLANASDVDGDELSVDNLNASNGELTDNGDGTYTFTPDENFNGSVELSYDVSDGTTTTPASGSIDVTAVNDVVEAGDVDLGSVEEDGSITFSAEDVIANSTDIDGDEITLSEIKVSENYGTLTDNGNGTYTFQPNENYSGNDIPLEFTVTDGETASQGTASLDVTAVNDGPEVSGDVDFTMDEDGTITITEEQLLANASDVDGDALSVENLSAANGELTDNGDGTYTFTPDENFNGSVELSYDVSDGTTTTPASGSIDVAAVNDAVEAGDVDLGSVEEDGSITFSAEDVIANSPDIDGDDITLSEISVSEDYGTLTNNGNGTYTFEPNEDYNGNDVPLEFTVTDGETTSQGIASLDVTAVNDGPEVSGDVSFEMAEDGTITITEEQLLANASDVDGDELSVENLSAGNGDLTDNGDGTYTFTPDENFNGSVDLSYDVSDGTDSTPVSGTIDVAAVNDAVEVGDADFGSVEEDGSITFSAEDVIANSTDIDGDEITLSEISVSDEYGTLTENGDGTFTFQPNENYNGNDIPLEFTVTDGETTSQGTVSLDVTAVNDGPEVSGDVEFMMDEDGSITITEDQLLANASDVDGDELSVENLSAGNGELTDNGDGTYKFTPDENFNGSVELSYDVSDGTTTTPASGSIDVTAVNDAVEAGDVDLGRVEEDGSITFSAEDIIANSSDIDGDDITLSEISVSDEYGRLTENGDGTYTFQPNENYNGADVPLEFTVSDGETTSQGTASLDVTAVNDGPEVSGDVDFTMDEDGTITISEEQLLANASDVDGDELSVDNLNASNGELTDNGDGTYTFTPDENFNGSVELSYDVSDGTTTTPASGSIDVTAVNDVVEAGDVDLGSVEEDGSITFSAEDVIANSTDIDGDEITLSEIKVSENYGTLTDNGNGTYTFQPNENYSGNDIPLEFTVTDGETASQGTASLDVTAVNDGPEVSGDVDFTMDEDGTITITEEQLLANASDVDGDALSVENLSAANGELTDNGDGTYTFTPDENFNGSVDLSYDVSDGTTTTPASGSIDVTAVNDAVEAGDVDLGSVEEDGSITFSAEDVIANSFDIDGDDITLSEISVSDEYGTLTDNGDGTYTFQPNENYNADDVPLAFTVTDGETTSQGTASLDVTAVNDGPEVSGDVEFTMDEDGNITITEEQLLANASDVDGGELLVENLSAANGELTDNGDGTYTFTPDENFNGSVELSYDVTDGTTTTPASGSIDVAAVNDAVEAGDVDLGGVEEDGSITFSAEDVIANSTDIDGDEITLSEITVSENYGTLTDNGNGTYTFQPNEDYNGNDVPLEFTVSDGETTSQGTASLDVTAVNDGPEVSGGVEFEMAEDGTITITEEQLLANASDVDGDELSVENLSAGNGELTDNGDGTYTFTPDENFNGSVELSYDVSDGTTTIPASGSIDVTAENDAVEAGDVDLGSVEEDGSITFSAKDVIANSSDIDGDDITLSEIFVSKDYGTLTNNGNGTYTFEPNEDYNGNDVPLEFTVTDGETTSQGIASLDVTAVNDGPEVSGDVEFEMAEDGTITITEEQLLANASDVDGDELSVQNLNAGNGEIIDNGDGSYTFTPDENFNGSVDLSYDVSDGTTTIPASGSIDVTAVNDAVEAGDVDLGRIEEDSSITFSAEDIIVNSTDIDGDDITLSEISVSDEYGTLTNNGDGTYTFEPNDDYNGNDVPLEFTVTDGETTSQGTASLDVTAVNDGPEVSGDVEFEMAEDGTITITEEQLLANASDVDGDELSVENLSAGNGELTHNGDGTYTFTPDENFNGSVELSYDVSDGTTTTPASGSIDVTAVNDVVEAGDVDLGSVEEDGSITFSAEDVIANSTDIDGDEITLSEIKVSENYGTLTYNGNGTYTFQPNENYSGNDIPLEFTVTDGETASQGTASLDVTAVNDGPEVSGDVDFTMDEDGTITITEEQLLANASDVDGDALSVENLSAANGELTDNGDGTYTFTPDENFNGSVDLSYDVSDGTTTTPASGSIDVTAVNDAVEAGDVDLGSVEEDGSITFSAEDVIANSFDIDGDDITLSEISVSDEYGTLTDNGDGTYTFQPNENYNADDVPLAFTVTDGETTSQGTASLDVTAVNDGPEVSGDVEFTMDEDGNITITEEQLLANASDVDGGELLNDGPEVSGGVDFTMAEDGTITISEEQLLANASDVDGDELSVENLSAGNGELTDNGDGTYTFKPDENFNGSVELGYDVSDGTTTTPASGSIDVTAVNDAVEAGDVDLGSIEEDSSITFSAEDIIVNSTDIDGDDITLSEISVSDEYGTLTNNGDGTYTFEPNDDYNGTDVPLEFTVTDGETTSQGIASLDVTAVNDGPEVSGDVEFEMAEDGTITITEEQLLANASDVDGDELSVQNLNAGNGEIIDNGDGSYTFTPDKNFNGSVDLSYDVSDGTTTIPASGSIDVTAVNDAVEAGDVDLGRIEEDSSITFSAEDIIANSTDIDGDDITLSEISVSDEYGTLTNNGDGTYTFEPKDDYNGTDVPLEFTVTDGETTSQGTARLDVTAVNDGPDVSGDVEFEMAEDGTITITEEQLLANASDVDGDELSIENLSADNGELTDNGDGTYTFTPDANFNGSVDLSYDVSDGTTSAPASGTIDVAAVNDAVEAGDVDLGRVEEDNAISFSAEDLIANSNDIDGDEIVLSDISVSADYGTLTDNGDGTYTFQPNDDYNGNVPFEFTVTDGETTSEATASLEVTAENDAPEVAGDVGFAIDEDGVITITEEQLLANAGDVDGEALSVKDVTAENGEITDNGDGTYTFVPDENFHGTVDLDYLVTDGITDVPAGGRIEVVSINDAPEAENQINREFEEDVTSHIRLDEIPELGTVEIMVDGEWQPMAQGIAYDADNDVRFVPDEDIVSDMTRDIQVGTSDGRADLSDWGEKVDSKTLQYTEGDVTITTQSSDDALKAYNGNTHRGAGIGDKDNNGLGKGESIIISVDGEEMNQISFDLDGIDSWFKESSPGANDAWTKVHIKAYDADGNLIDEQLSSGSYDAGYQDTHTFVTDSPVDHFELSTAGGNGNFVVRGMTLSKSVQTDVNLTVISPDGTEERLPIKLNLQNLSADEPIGLNETIEEHLEPGASGETVTLTKEELLAEISDVEGDTLSVASIDIIQGEGTVIDNEDGTYTVTPAKDYDGELKLTYTVSDGQDTVDNIVNLSRMDDTDADENTDDAAEEAPDKTTGRDREKNDRGHGNDEDGVDEDNPAFLKKTDEEGQDDDDDAFQTAADSDEDDNDQEDRYDDDNGEEEDDDREDETPSSGSGRDKERNDRGHGNDEDGVDEDNPAFLKKNGQDEGVEDGVLEDGAMSDLEILSFNEGTRGDQGRDWTGRVEDDDNLATADADSQDWVQTIDRMDDDSGGETDSDDLDMEDTEVDVPLDPEESENDQLLI